VGRDIDVDGILVYESGDAGPCVVVLHEWWGLVPHIKDVCDRFTAAGFRAVAPDLYDGAAALETEPDRAEWLMARLNRDRAVRAVRQVVAYLRQGGCDQVALVGFCMGSALAIAASARCAVNATVGYYGIWPHTGERTISNPILIHVAEHEEHNWPALPAHFPRWFEGMSNVELHIYDGTQHAFFNDARPDLYDQMAAQLSWDRTLTFLTKHLAHQ
jgi:carboxymethylenebutenolidase